MEGVGGCRGEEWPHSQSILLEEQGCQEGPPWVWPAVLSGSGCCPAPLVRGAGFSPCCPPLCLQLVHRGILGPRRDRQGLRALAAPRAHTTVGFPAPPPAPLWGKGCRAASDWLSCKKGGEGAGKVDACVCFQFQFLPPSLSFPPSFLFFFLPSLLLAPSVAGSLRM